MSCTSSVTTGCLTLTTAGDACTFPFTYKGTEYNECTSIANNGVPWCTTAMGWGNCEKSCTTTGCLTITTDGDACTFPFTYKACQTAKGETCAFPFSSYGTEF